MAPSGYNSTRSTSRPAANAALKARVTALCVKGAARRPILQSPFRTSPNNFVSRTVKKEAVAPTPEKYVHIWSVVVCAGAMPAQTLDSYPEGLEVAQLLQARRMRP